MYKCPVKGCSQEAKRVSSEPGVRGGEKRSHFRRVRAEPRSRMKLR